MGPLVTTEWLAGELGKPDLAVFDATMYLPNETKNGWVEFKSAHLPGARYFDIDVVADQDSSLPHMVPTPGRFAKLMGAMGVSNTTRVVFYDQKGLASAARGWWLMGLFGHDNAAVLDGGLPKWMRENRAVESGEPAAPAATVFNPDYRATRLRGVGDIIANVTTQAELVLDARAGGRFTGATPEPRAGMRSGHMPGAASDLVATADILKHLHTVYCGAVAIEFSSLQVRRPSRAGRGRGRPAPVTHARGQWRRRRGVAAAWVCVIRAGTGRERAPLAGALCRERHGSHAVDGCREAPCVQLDLARRGTLRAYGGHGASVR